MDLCISAGKFPCAYFMFRRKEFLIQGYLSFRYSCCFKASLLHFQEEETSQSSVSCPVDRACRRCNPAEAVMQQLGFRVSVIESSPQAYGQGLAEAFEMIHLSSEWLWNCQLSLALGFSWNQTQVQGLPTTPCCLQMRGREPSLYR